MIVRGETRQLEPGRSRAQTPSHAAASRTSPRGDRCAWAGASTGRGWKSSPRISEIELDLPDHAGIVRAWCWAPRPRGAAAADLTDEIDQRSRSDANASRRAGSSPRLSRAACVRSSYGERWVDIATRADGSWSWPTVRLNAVACARAPRPAAPLESDRPADAPDQQATRRASKRHQEDMLIRGRLRTAGRCTRPRCRSATANAREGLWTMASEARRDGPRPAQERGGITLDGDPGIGARALPEGEGHHEEPEHDPVPAKPHEGVALDESEEPPDHDERDDGRHDRPQRDHAPGGVLGTRHLQSL